MHVLDDDDHRRLLLEVAQDVEQVGADAGRLLGRQHPLPRREQLRTADARAAQELVDHPEGDQRLPALPAGPQDARLLVRGEEVLEQRR